jgi:hypothetical protein
VSEVVGIGRVKHCNQSRETFRQVAKYLPDGSCRSRDRRWHFGSPIELFGWQFGDDAEQTGDLLVNLRKAGTTRPRINFFMNKLRKLGFIEYNDGLHVHSSLLNVFLFDSEHGTAGTSSLPAKGFSPAPKK